MKDVQVLLLAAEVLKLAEKLQDEAAAQMHPFGVTDARETQEQRRLWKKAHPASGFAREALKELESVASDIT